jgi:hypothetical protein
MKINLSNILALDAGPEKTAAVVHWVQELYPAGEERPVLVGGSAVELYTGGAYVTGDLDFVGTVPHIVDIALRENGFRKEGRHWIHEEGRIFLEFPSLHLAEGEKATERKFNNRNILLVSPEDLIVDRLSAWVYWKSEVDGVNAYLLYQALEGDLDAERLGSRVEKVGVGPAYQAVISLYVREKGKIPGKERFEVWAREIPG